MSARRGNIAARFSLATHFDDTLPERVAPYGVFELSGKLSADVVGGGRATLMLGHVGQRTLARHVAACRRAGLGFNYLLNAACMDNPEYTRGTTMDSTASRPVT